MAQYTLQLDDLIDRIESSGACIATLAHHAGLSYNTVKYIANGTNKNPTVKTLDAIDAAWWALYFDGPDA